MHALFMAMVLAGAGGLTDIQGNGTLLPPVPMVPPPAPVPPAPTGIRPYTDVPPQRAHANLASYFSTDDYPMDAVRARHIGTTSFRLVVGTNGRVSDCIVIASSGSAPLDEATCRILRARARYLPARGSDGQPVVGRDAGRVTWRLPDGSDRAGLSMSYWPARPLTPDAERPVAADYPIGVPLFADAVTQLHVAIGRDGRVIGCETGAGTAPFAYDRAACRFYTARARFEPARDATGAVACDVAWINVIWRRHGANRQPQPSGTSAPEGPPPLRLQLNADLCPGWPTFEPGR